MDVYFSEDEEQAAESLEVCPHSHHIALLLNLPVQTCVNASSELILTEDSKKSKKDEDEAIPIDVLTDEIIGLLEQSSHYWRTIGNRTFEMLSSLVQETTINLIISVS